MDFFLVYHYWAFIQYVLSSLTTMCYYYRIYIAHKFESEVLSVRRLLSISAFFIYVMDCFLYVITVLCYLAG